jgi:hypothetical protein
MTTHLPSGDVMANRGMIESDVKTWRDCVDWAGAALAATARSNVLSFMANLG